MHVNSIGQYVSFVLSVKIILTRMFISVILNINNPSTVSIHTKRSPKDLENLSALDQLKLITTQTDLIKFVTPSTAQVTPLTHVVFKTSLETFVLCWVLGLILLLMMCWLWL